MSRLNLARRDGGHGLLRVVDTMNIEERNIVFISVNARNV